MGSVLSPRWHPPSAPTVVGEIIKNQSRQLLRVETLQNTLPSLSVVVLIHATQFSCYVGAGGNVVFLILSCKLNTSFSRSSHSTFLANSGV